jgi:hypothetical protein
MFGERRNARVLNSNSVKRFERVNWAKRFAVFLEDAEPFGSIRRVRGLVYACIKFGFDDPAYFLVHARWYWHVLLYPWLVRHNWDFDGGKEFGFEFAAFGIVPCETFILFRHEVVHEKSFLVGKEVA